MNYYCLLVIFRVIIDYFNEFLIHYILSYKIRCRVFLHIIHITHELPVSECQKKVNFLVLLPIDVFK